VRTPKAKSGGKRGNSRAEKQNNVGADMPAPSAKSGGKGRKSRAKKRGGASITDKVVAGGRIAEVLIEALTQNGTDLVRVPAVSQKGLGRSSSMTKGRGLR